MAANTKLDLDESISTLEEWVVKLGYEKAKSLNECVFRGVEADLKKFADVELMARFSALESKQKFKGKLVDVWTF